MNLLDFIFSLRRDKREGRQDARDERRERRETREELLGLYDRLAALAPDETSRDSIRKMLFDSILRIVPEVEADAAPEALALKSGEPSPVLEAAVTPLEDFVDLVAHLNELGRHQEALKLLDLIAGFAQPFPAEATFEKSIALDGLGDVEGALATLEDDLANRERPRRVLQRRCLILQGCGRLEEAAETAQRLVDDKPDVLGLATLGWVRFNEKDYGASLDLFDQALALDAENVHVLVVRLAVSTHSGADDATDVAERVLAVSPDNPDAHRVLALAALGDGAIDAALQHAAALVESAPDDARAHLLHARVLTRNADYDGAFEALDLAQTRGAPQVQVLLGRLDPVLQMPVSGEGHANARKVISLLSAILEAEDVTNDQRATALLLRAFVLLIHGGKSLANEDFQEAVTLGLPPDVERVATEHLVAMADRLKSCRSRPHATLPLARPKSL